MPRVIIIGAGFGGLFTARHLANTDVDVLLIDKNNYHTFTPLIYQVATCGLEAEEVAYPVRKIFRNNPNVDFMLGEVTEVDAERKLVRAKTNGTSREEAYDYLVVAAGSETNFFGNDALAQRSFGLKDLNDAMVLRNHILRLFEKASWTDDDQYKRALTTMVVVGGGPTGIETAGALYELYNSVLHREYHNLGGLNARVILVEATDTLLRPYPEKLRKSALEQLRSIGVEVMLEKMVESVEKDRVLLKGGEAIDTYTLVWAAGVQAWGFVFVVGVELARGGRIPIKPTIEVEGLDGVYALGDIAYLEDPDGNPYAQQIPVAQQQAKLAAKNILRRVANEPEETFVFFDKGTMATIGRSRAVAWVYNRIQMTGFLAWVAWLGLHLITLLGFRNRVQVLINWMWNYLAFDRVARVILEAPQPERDPVSGD